MRCLEDFKGGKKRGKKGENKEEQRIMVKEERQ